MADLTPLKVKIGKNDLGQARYPQFNNLPIVQAAGMDWSHYIDREGSGWLYDAEGHDDDSVDSPRGQQWGIMLVPAEFVRQAVLAFPQQCEAITAADAETFYNRKVARDEPEEEVDEVVLQKIRDKQALGLELTADELQAIDPMDTARGVRPNRRKRLTTFTKDRGINVVDPQ